MKPSPPKPIVPLLGRRKARLTSVDDAEMVTAIDLIEERMGELADKARVSNGLERVRLHLCWRELSALRERLLPHRRTG